MKNYKKIVARSNSKQELHSTNNNNTVLIRSHSISRLFSQNKTIMNYLEEKMQNNEHFQQDNISTLPYSPSHHEQYSRFSFNQYSKSKVRNQLFYNEPRNIINKKNSFLELKKQTCKKKNKESSIEKVNCLILQNSRLKKEINSYKVILQQISDKNKRTSAIGINSLSSYDDNLND